MDPEKITRVKAAIEKFESQEDADQKCCWINKKKLTVCGVKCRTSKLRVFGEFDRRCFDHARKGVGANLFATVKTSNALDLARPQKWTGELGAFFVRSFIENQVKVADDDILAMETCDNALLLRKVKLQTCLRLEHVLSGRALSDPNPDPVLQAVFKDLVPYLIASERMQMLSWTSDDMDPPLPWREAAWKSREKGSLQEDVEWKLTLLHKFLMHATNLGTICKNFRGKYNTRFGLDLATRQRLLNPERSEVDD